MGVAEVEGVDTLDAAAPPPEVDFAVDPLPSMPPPMPAPSPPSTPGKPLLSSRVGKLAESLEDGGRIADAALLYEVQAVLVASGR